MADVEELKVEQMQTDIEHKRHDMAHKEGLLKYEPWKVAATAMGAGAALTLALLALLTFVHPSPQTINVHIEGKLPQ